ncbi:MAG: MmgE/PrpD family protein [Proteobacteria bacterium]|nr:MmgE/PrpD family protein [Pseudomonadota bacterium]
MDAIARFAEHVVRTRLADIPAEALDAAKTFLLDTLGVGVMGSGGPHAAELVAAAGLWGEGGSARVWGRGARLPAPSAALANAYQIHNSEFDCAHEGAVIHPMTALSAATFAFAEREGGVSGRDLLAAIVLGVDVACHIAVSSRTPLRFFRPATCGAFAATAAIGRLMGLDAGTLVSALGIAYSQMCGTMQAHSEGLALLGMQIGFNARNAIAACDMAARGIAGPVGVLEGPYGYFRLFEGEGDLASALAALGKTWRITEVSHKPFPTGRAAHGTIDGVLRLKRRHGFAPREVAAVRVRVPSLTHRLVGRPPKEGMTTHYARLCAAFVAARALIRDTVGVEDFAPEALGDPATLALARRFALEVDDNPDPNALSPASVEVALAGGGRHAITVADVYGGPRNRMPRAAQVEKFRRNWKAAAAPLAEAGGEALIARIDRLEEVADVRSLVDLMVP